MSDNISAFSSEIYDKNIKKTLPYYEDIYKQVVEIIKCVDKLHFSWLDIGCGTGKMASYAYKHVDLKRFVFNDISQEMIAIVKEHFKSESSEYVIDSAINLDYENQFDVVSAILVNHYNTWEQRKKVVENCYRALNQDGIFITFENYAPFSDEGKQLFLKRWYNFQLQQGKTKQKSKEHIERYGKDYFPITITENLEMMRNYGFKSVEIIWLSYMQVGFLAIK